DDCITDAGEGDTQPLTLLLQAGVLLGQGLLKLSALHLPNSLGLPLDLLRLLVEVNEAGDLGPDDDRDQRLDEVVHRPEGIRSLDGKVIALKGGEKDDGGVPRFFTGTDQLGRLKA